MKNRPLKAALILSIINSLCYLSILIREILKYNNVNIFILWIVLYILPPILISSIIFFRKRIFYILTYSYLSLFFILLIIVDATKFIVTTAQNSLLLEIILNLGLFPLIFYFLFRSSIKDKQHI